MEQLYQGGVVGTPGVIVIVNHGHLKSSEIFYYSEIIL